MIRSMGLFNCYMTQCKSVCDPALRRCAVKHYVALQGGGRVKFP